MNPGTATITRSVGVTLPGIEPSEPGAYFEMVLPWPPSVNTYWRSVVMGGRVRVLISEKGRLYRKAVIRQVGRGVQPLTGPLLFDATFHPPDKRRRDIDNLPKGLFDALVAAGVLADDSQIRELRTRFGAVWTDGAAVVRIVPLGTPE